jgi:DNA processing protein
MQRDELASWLRLTLAPGVGNIAARKLLAAFGLPQAVFAQSLTALNQCVSAAQSQAVQLVPEGLDALTQATLDWLAASQRDGVTRAVITLADPTYPKSLLALDDPPLVLYMTGSRAVYRQLAAKDLANDIAIVGSRNPTPQGANNARSFAGSFAQAGLHVVSGLALGIDGAVHEGALDAREASPATAGSTIAIVGTGLDRVYPKQHHELAHRIATHGVILSEFPIGTPPISANFPKRNRIISALTQGTLVVEAALRSGSLITARLAAEQGKDVFAIPGSIHSTLSKGCHSLIKQGAKLVESAQDVLEELTHPPSAALALPKAKTRAKVKAQAGDPDDPDHANHPNESHGLFDDSDSSVPDTNPQTALLTALGYDPVSLDALIARTGHDAATLQAHLLELELIGEVVRLPGGLFQRHALA